MSIAFKQNCIFVFILILAIAASIVVYRTLRQDWILFRHAEAKYDEKKYNEAIDLYEKSLKEGLPIFHMSVNYANSHVALGQFNEAIPLYRDYLSNHPKDGEARLSLAKALTWVGNTKEAETEYTRILEENNEK